MNKHDEAIMDEIEKDLLELQEKFRDSKILISDLYKKKNELRSRALDLLNTQLKRA